MSKSHVDKLRTGSTTEKFRNNYDAIKWKPKEKSNASKKN